MTSRKPRPVLVSPRTPSDVFAAMALSPSMATPRPSAVLTLLICPPSPDLSAPPDCSSPVPETYRPLSTVEARQLTALLHARFFPLRSSARLLMSESIKLAEELHGAGIRWDRVRRVMGMHLRGIWAEGAKVDGAGGLRAME